jgi:hypothetical protein
MPDFAAIVTATGGSLPPPGPLLASLCFRPKGDSHTILHILILMSEA